MKGQVIKQNVGIDLSKDDMKVNFQQLLLNQKTKIKGSKRFKNTLSGFKDLVKWIEIKCSKEIEVRITMEATGVYYEQLSHYLHEQTDYYLSVLLPSKSKAFAKSLNVKSKTDKIDAKLLGQLGLERNVEQWQPISDQMRPLRQLTRNRVNLIELKTSITNKIHAHNHSYKPSKVVLKQLNAQLRLLERQIKKMEIEIEELIGEDEILEEKVANICEIKGLGVNTVATIIAETDGFVLFTSRSQLVSYAGYDVVLKESGTSQKGRTRISKKGNRYIRRALFFPAVLMSRYEPEFIRLSARIFERTKIKMKANVAVQRKALVLIYTLFKKNEAYDPGFADNQRLLKEEEESCRQETNPAYCG